MFWLIFGTFIVLFISLAALVRSLRLDNKQKTVLTGCSLISLVLTIVTFVLTIIQNSYARLFLLISFIVSVSILIISVALLRKKYNKVFTDKAKEHKESVAKILAEEQENKEK